MKKNLASLFTRYGVYVLIVLSVLWSSIYIFFPKHAQRWFLLGESNFLGGWSNTACILAASMWLARKIYIRIQETEPQNLHIMRRWLQYLRKHHVLFGWVTLVTATAHGLYFATVSKDNTLHAITGWIAWGVLVMLVAMGTVLDKKLTPTGRLIKIRLYHVGLAALFMVVVTLHSFVLFGGLALWTVVWILMRVKRKAKTGSVNGRSNHGEQKVVLFRQV